MLSPHFSQQEFENSERAERLCINNTIPQNLMLNAIKTALLMEQIRKLLGDKPITINSVYRSPTVNKAVGGAKTSEHLQALACDFVCPAFGTPYQIAKVIEASTIQYGQLIYEGTWVHISVQGKHKLNKLTMKKGKYYSGIVNIYK
jgi:hypothetical protein